MGDCMEFPKDWEKFLEDYSFKDKEEIYTNGARLIPTFRVEQMMEHYLQKPVDAVPVAHWRWRGQGRLRLCSKCGSFVEFTKTLGASFWKFCPNCGAKMDLEVKDA